LDAYATQGRKSLQTLSNGDETLWGLKALDEFFGFHNGNAGRPVMQITADVAREFARKRQSEGVSNATVKGSLRLLRRMLRLAYDEGKIPKVPKILLVKEPPARKGFLDQDQFDKLLAALLPSLRALAVFLYYSGARLGEAKQIGWQQVDLEAGLVFLGEEQTKNGAARTIALPDILIEMLQKIEPKDGLVFDTTNLRKQWMRACQAAGLGTYRITDKGGWVYRGLIIHDLRRSGVRNLVRAGVPERTAMAISGHKTRAVFDRYNIVDTRDVQVAMRQVEAVANRKNLAVQNSEKTVKMLPPVEVAAD
jgi:integrase